MATPVEIAVKATGTAAASRAIGQVESKTSKLGSVLKGLAVGGVAVAGAALVKLGIDSVKAASDAQQSIGATETVFRKYADTVIKRSDQAATAVGLSANEYRELANVTGASLAGAGIPLKKVTDLTGDLTKRAADMAATFGGTTREAIESVGSALRGETDPIERYGVSIKASDVSARLAAQGQAKLTGEALKQAEMMTRLDLIFEKTQTSQGAFARESDTLAGAQQRLTAQWENMKAEIGGALIPVLSDLATFTGQTVLPAVDKLWDKLAPARETIANAVSGVKDFIGAIRGGDWKGAWDKARQATTFALTAQAKAVRSFATDRLIPGIRDALGRARTAWAQKWSNFSKDPEKSYDKTMAVTRKFGHNLIEEHKRIAIGATLSFLREFRKLPGATGRIGVQTLNSWRQSTNAMPGLARHIAADMGVNFLSKLRDIPHAAGNVMALIVSAVRNGLSGLGSIAAGLGRQVIDGFVSGLVTGPIISRLDTITNLIPKHKGPPAKDRKLLRRSGHLIIKGLIDGFDDGSAGVARVLDRLTASISKRFDQLRTQARKHMEGKAEAARLRALTHAEAARIKSLKKHDDALLKNARSQDALNKKLDAARSKLKALATASKDYAASIRDSVVATGDVTTLGKGEEGTATIGGILDQMRDRVAAAQRFADLIRKLTKAGLNKTSLRQLLAAGVEGGLTTAEALASGGKDAIGQVNKLTGELTKAGTGLGDKSAKTMFGAGVKAADALVAGLESRERKLDRVAQRLARKLAKGITGQTRASARDALKDGGPGTPRTVRVRLTADQVSQLQRGREIQADLDAYAASGGRRRP